MTNTIYIHQPEKAFSFTRLPNFLFEAPTFQPLSNEAKVLYAFVLRRAELSRKNGWADEYGRVYLYYPICEVVALLRCGRQKAVNTLRELQYAGLVEIQKQGCGKPNRIYPKSYEAVPNTDFKKSGLSEIFSAGKPAGKEWNGERSSMAQHAILRFEKHKGHPAGPLEAHHERKKEQYASNPDIDTSRSKYNFHIVKPDGRYYHFIQSRIEQARCRTRKDSTRFVDTLITASPEFFKGKSPKEIAAYFQRAADFLIDRVGRENIVSAMVHMDEKTPHLHLVFVPLTKDNRLCAKEIIGNRANLTKWQDDFHACMVEQYPDLERGESASKTGRKHIPTRLFKQAVNLSKQARAIEAVLSGITPLNAGKKKEEALSMLKKWFPQMENFSGQLKKYKVTINDLLAENEKLEVRAKASEKGKMNDTMERAKLKSELDDMRRLVDRIPPEILAELKRQQRQHGKER